MRDGVRRMTPSPNTIFTPGDILILQIDAENLETLVAKARLADWAHRQPVSEGLIALVLVTTLAFAWTAEVGGGLAAITGAFIAGGRP